MRFAIMFLIKIGIALALRNAEGVTALACRCRVFDVIAPLHDYPLEDVWQNGIRFPSTSAIASAKNKMPMRSYLVAAGGRLRAFG